jgi:hypothetical protein
MQHAIPPEIAKAALRVVEEYAPETTVSIEIDDQLFANRPLGEPWKHTVANLYKVTDRPAAKIIFDASKVADLDALRAKLPCDCSLRPFNEGPNHLVDILAPGVSKASALKLLVARADLTMKEVIAFGDGDGDIEMLSQCGLGVAMGNASEAVKAAAHWITASNDEDGVAVAREQVLEK